MSPPRTLLGTIVVAATGLVLAVPAVAQVQRGTIYGTAHDATKAVLPGVVVQLTSDLIAPIETVTGARGEFRFPDLDPGSYSLKAVLEGFAPYVRQPLLVGVGTSIEIPVELVVSGVTAEIVVTAATPVLDVRRHGQVSNFDQVMLSEIPTARDPWALMQHVPGVSISRPNVGGSESTTQAQFAARGDDGSNTMWSIDGVTITDMAAVGTSTTYYDFNLFEEAQFTTGSLDSRQQTGGLAINLVTKRGTNAWRGSGRTYFSNDALQGENIADALKAQGLSGNRIQQFAEYGADGGGSLWERRAWFWGAAGRTDVRQLAINGFPDNSIVNTLASRVDAQMGSASRLSFLYHRGEKLKDGRAAGVDRPPETTWDQSGATNIYKAEVSQVFGPALFLSAKFAYVDVAFRLTPQGGLDAQAYRDFATQIWHGSFNYSSSERPQYQTQLDGSWARGRHDLRFGFHYRQTESLEETGWPGDGTFTIVNAERLGLPPGVGFANLTRAAAVASETATTSLYLGDVMTAGRWTLDLGLRFDAQRARNVASETGGNGLAPSVLPPLEYSGGSDRTWRDLSPRVGATVRLTDRTIARASYARFSSQMGYAVGTFDNAARAATIQYTFRDTNGDHLAQTSELLGPTGSVTNVNPADPAAPYSPNQVDPDISSPASQGFSGGVEREVMPEFSLGVNVGFRRASNATWAPFIGLTRDSFVEYRTAGSGTVVSSTPVYRLAPGTSLPPGNGRVLTNREEYAQRSWNVDLVGTKRLANRWMVRGHVTLQQQHEYFDDPAQSIQDPTPRFDPTIPLASGFVDGGLAVNLQPFSEFILHATWLYSLSGLYELPWGINVAGALYGRQGYPRGDIITINRPDGLGLTPVLVDRDIDAGRYAGLHLLDLRVQKKIRLGRASATLDLDLFNVFNTGVVLRQFREAASTSFGNPLELVAPRLVRLGLRFTF